MPGLERPALPVDLVVSEATYGNRLHADRTLSEARLIQTISEVLSAGGRVLIPAFAIGRAQEVLLIVKDAMRAKRLPEVPVFVDGMVRAVCGVYNRHPKYVSSTLGRQIMSAHPFYTGTIRPVRDAVERKEVLDAGPCVIVASSGMLQGGPSSFYAAQMCPNVGDAVLITGYQDEESPGASLLRLAGERGPRQLRVGNSVVDVRCRFETYGLSAHADRMQMVGLIEAIRPRSVVLVHGDRDAKESLANSLGVKDITLADDGTMVTVARTPAHVRSRREAEISADEARRLVGPDMGEPLRVSSLSAAWFGKVVDANARGRFVETLVASGAARRDEQDAGLLWSLVPAARGARAGSKQQSANDSMTGTDTALAVDAEREASLRKENPKGRLLELCMQLRYDSPTFDVVADGAGFIGTASVHTSDGVKQSGRYRTRSIKVAEQATAEELLRALVRERSDDDVPVVAEEKSSRDPRTTLNEMRQMGLIDGYGYDEIERTGPSHAPVFVVRGWVDCRGERQYVPTVEARGRKAAEGMLAPAMMRLAVEMSG